MRDHHQNTFLQINTSKGSKCWEQNTRTSLLKAASFSPRAASWSWSEVIWKISLLWVEIKVHYVNADTGEQGRRAPVILARSHDDRHLPLNADDTTTQGQGMCSVQTVKLKEAKTFAYSTPPIYGKILGMLHIKGKDRRSTMTSAEEEQKKNQPMLLSSLSNHRLPGCHHRCRIKPFPF